jgi:hypothetical protein
VNTYYASLTVPQLRERILADDPTARGLSRLRKGELIALLRELESKRAENEKLAGEPQVFQGAMHETSQEREDAELVDDLIGAELGDLALSLRELAGAVRSIVEPTQAAAKTLGRVAYGHLRATVRSMGRTVTGRVVDTVVRTPDVSGEGRVLVAVRHDGHPRVTMHRLTDVELTPLAS